MNKSQGNRWWNRQLLPQDVSCHRSWLFWSRTLTWHIIGFKQRSLVLVASCSFVLCLIMVVLTYQIEAKLYRFRPVSAGALLSIPSTSSLVPIIIFELNNAGIVCIIVESWLKVTTPDGTSNLQCNWEFLGVVFGWGRKLTTGCSYGGDVWTIMLCVADWSNKKLWNGNPWRKVLVADNCTVIFVCLWIILLVVVYLSINQSINYNPNWYCLSIIQSVIQSINPSIHPSNWLCLLHTEKHIAFLWLNNMLLITSCCNTKIHSNLYPKNGGKWWSN